MTDLLHDLGRHMVESEVLRLSSLTETVFQDAAAGGCDQRLIEAVRRARTALYTIVGEGDVAPLLETLEREIASGLDALAQHRARKVDNGHES